MFFLQILNNYFGVGGEEKNNILIHALYSSIWNKDKYRKKIFVAKRQIFLTPG